MGGSKQTQTTQQTKDPWGPAQGALKDVLSNVSAYGTDPSMFKPETAGARAGIDQMQALLNQPSAQSGVIGGILPGTQQGWDAGLKTLLNTAAGGNLGANPYLDSVLGTARNNAANAVNQQFSGAGRYGSGAHTGVLADKLGAIETQARYGDYEKERANQLNAAQLLSGYGLQGAGLAGQLDSANLQRGQLGMQLGGMRDDLTNAENRAPLTATEWMAGLATPIAGLGGTSSGTTTTHTPANIPGMIGGGIMTGLGMLGTGGLGGLGGLGALTGGSSLGSLAGLGGSALMNNWGNVGQSSVGAGGLPTLGGFFR
jgi:hypothetical protein